MGVHSKVIYRQISKQQNLKWKRGKYILDSGSFFDIV